MGVSTKVYVVKQHEIDEFLFKVVKALKKGFGDKFDSDSVNWRNCNGINSNADYYFYDLNFTLDYENRSFSNGKENRSIFIFHHPKEELRRDFYEIYFNMWGHSKEIANYLCDYFGGFADYNDCDAINIDYCVAQPQSILGITN